MQGAKQADKVRARRKTKEKAPPSTRTNPFETRITRRKFEVLGRRSKNQKGKPGISRARGEQKRNETLLEEYKQQNKSNVFMDKRFGEYAKDLTLEQKMLKRFALERKNRFKRKNAFNLEDEEDLTHFGQSLSTVKNFDDAGLVLDDDQDPEDIGETHFGGFLTKKSKQEEEAELQEKLDRITNSKLGVMHMKEEAFQLNQKLEDDWHGLRTTLLEHKMTDEHKLDKDDYDVLVNELLFDARSQSAKRIRTSENKEEIVTDEASSYPVPESVDELIFLLHNRADGGIIPFIEKVIVYNQPKLAPGNKAKIESFFHILLLYARNLSVSPDSNPDLLEQIVGPLHDCLKYTRVSCSRLLLGELCQIRGTLSGGSLGSFGLYEMFLLGIAIQLFPLKAKAASISQYALLIGASILSEARPNCLGDLAKMLMLCSVLHQYAAVAKLFIPEVISVLASILALAVPAQEKARDAVPWFWIKGLKDKNLLVLEEDLSTQTLPSCSARSLMLATSQDSSSICRLVGWCTALLVQYGDLYSSLPSAAAIFSPVLFWLEFLPHHLYPTDIQALCVRAKETLSPCTPILPPSTLVDDKPAILEMLEPTISDRFNVETRKSSSNRSDSEKKRLVRKFKQEFKGAAKEIRKDAKFLARKSLEDKLQRDASRKKKTKDIERMLADQQGDLRSMARKRD